MQCRQGNYPKVQKLCTQADFFNRASSASEWAGRTFASVLGCCRARPVTADNERARIGQVSKRAGERIMEQVATQRVRSQRAVGCCAARVHKCAPFTCDDDDDDETSCARRHRELRCT